MRQSNIPMIVFSVIAFVVMAAVIAGAVFLIAYHIKYKEADLSPAPVFAGGDKKTEEPASSENGAASDVPSDKPSASAPEEQTAFPTDMPTDRPTETKEAVVPGYYLKQTTPADQGYMDGIVFIGGSNSYGYILHRLLKNGANTDQVWFIKEGSSMTDAADGMPVFCSGESDRENKTYSSLSSLLEKNKPGVIVIEFPDSALSVFEGDGTKFRYDLKALIDVIYEHQENARIICRSALPVSAVSDDAEAVRNINGWICTCVSEAADNGVNAYYADVYSLLTDENGKLTAQYADTNGWKKETYSAILDYLQTHKPN